MARALALLPSNAGCGWAVLRRSAPPHKVARRCLSLLPSRAECGWGTLRRTALPNLPFVAARCPVRPLPARWPPPLSSAAALGFRGALFSATGPPALPRRTGRSRALSTSTPGARWRTTSRNIYAWFLRYRWAIAANTACSLLLLQWTQDDVLYLRSLNVRGEQTAPARCARARPSRSLPCRSAPRPSSPCTTCTCARGFTWPGTPFTP